MKKIIALDTFSFYVDKEYYFVKDQTFEVPEEIANRVLTMNLAREEKIVEKVVSKVKEKAEEVAKPKKTRAKKTADK